MVPLHRPRGVDQLARFADQAQSGQPAEQLAKRLLQAADGGDFVGLATSRQPQIEQRILTDGGQERNEMRSRGLGIAGQARPAKAAESRLPSRFRAAGPRPSLAAASPLAVSRVARLAKHCRFRRRPASPPRPPHPKTDRPHRPRRSLRRSARPAILWRSNGDRIRPATRDWPSASRSLAGRRRRPRPAVGRRFAPPARASAARQSTSGSRGSQRDFDNPI